LSVGALMPCWMMMMMSFAWIPAGLGSRMKSPALPIQSEREPVPSKGLSGCSFGGRFYSLEDTWHPDLGEPFGVMHCVKCYCEPQRSKRKVFGKVSCRNIKQDCPAAKCTHPVLQPGHCCKTCPDGYSEQPPLEPMFDGYEFLLDKEKEGDLHKTYNDRSYLSSEHTHTSPTHTRTDFVALLTGVRDSWLPSSSGVARARFTHTHTGLAFSITYKRFSRPSRVLFLDSDGNTAFEFRVPKEDTDMICGVWKNLPKSHLRQLEAEQLRVSMVTSNGRREEITGNVIKHRALFAETFSAILSSEEEHAGAGGIAMVTLSESENNLHFILMLRGLITHTVSLVPIRVTLQYRQHVLREIRANISAQDTDFAEVLSELNSRELFWLSRGQLLVTVETEDNNPRMLSGLIAGRKSCDLLQSVIAGGEALSPTKTGGVGSAIFHLHDNGTLDYQVQVVGVSSRVIGVSLELKPRRRAKRSVLHELMDQSRGGWWAEPGGGRGQGSVGRMEARHIHMLLQNELFINVATETHTDGELRGQVISLLYNGLETSNTHELPVPLAGQLVTPPVSTSAGGHAWVALDDRCHLHYDIIVTGLSKGDELAVNAHLHGLAEIGEMDEASTNQRRLLTGFYGSKAQGVLRDLSVDLLRHLDQGTAFIQISTKLNPSGEIRAQVHVPNSCEFGSRGDVVEEAEFGDLVFVRDPEELRKDPLTCFFEGEHHTHGSHWTPQYNACFNCSCQKRTVICDPVICPALSCPHTLQPEDKCCPVCDESKDQKDSKAAQKPEEHPEGCYFEGDQKMHAPGTSWHPFVPPFGYIKCAVCTCKGATGEVHCEKVTCPLLSCSRPIRRSPTDCCKVCPVEAPPPEEVGEELMQGDGPPPCKFGRSYYQHSERWHPRVPLVGEVKCITCWCDHGVTRCQRKQCPVISCSNVVHRDGKCCPECEGSLSKEEEELLAKAPHKRKTWAH